MFPKTAAIRAGRPLAQALALVLALSGTVALGCNGGVVHPVDGGENTPEYCKDRSPEQNNCMACSSQPGCGWCGSPREGEAFCQPGNAQAAPTTCAGDWAKSTEQCEPPPPPAPLPPAAAGGASAVQSADLAGENEGR